MEKKTIGEFIAILRRANGMTQKDLAEKLNVSDKAVSRWERDECAPDITLLPAIAELFGVTTDELIKGERNAPSEELSSYVEKKNKKLTDMLVGKLKVRIWTQTVILLGAELAGVIMALIFNSAFLANIGFWVGTAFFFGAIVTNIIFVIQGKEKIRVAEAEGFDTLRLKKALIIGTEIVASLAAVLFTLILPLSNYSDVHVLIDSWYFEETAASAAVVALVSIIISLSVVFFTIANKSKRTRAKWILTTTVTVIWIVAMLLCYGLSTAAFQISEYYAENDRQSYWYNKLEDWCGDEAILSDVKKQICEQYNDASTEYYTFECFNYMFASNDIKAFIKVNANDNVNYICIWSLSSINKDNNINPVKYVSVGIIKEPADDEQLTDDEILERIKPYIIIDGEEAERFNKSYILTRILIIIGASACFIGATLAAVLVYIKRLKKINCRYSKEA